MQRFTQAHSLFGFQSSDCQEWGKQKRIEREAGQFKNGCFGVFLGLVVRILGFHCCGLVQSLVRELRYPSSHSQGSQQKRKKKKNGYPGAEGGQSQLGPRPFLRGHSGQGAFFLSSTVNCRLTVEHSEMTEVYKMRSPQHWSTGPRAAAAGDLISLRLQKVRMLPRLLTLQLSVSKAGDGEETAVFYVCAFLPLPPPSISRAFSHSPGPS